MLYEKHVGDRGLFFIEEGVMVSPGRETVYGKRRAQISLLVALSSVLKRAPILQQTEQATRHFHESLVPCTLQKGSIARPVLDRYNWLQLL